MRFLDLPIRAIGVSRLLIQNCVNSAESGTGAEAEAGKGVTRQSTVSPPVH